MDSIYREQLMDNYKNPKNKGLIDDVSVEVFDKNPFCGDEINLQLKIKDNVIQDIAFSGSSCAVSTASASITTEWARGRTIEEIKKVNRNDILEMLGVELTTSRIKCATLVLDALKKAIKKYE